MNSDHPVPDARNRAFLSVFWKGVRAGWKGYPETVNPYGDVRTWRGCVTFGRAFMRCWEQGRKLGTEYRDAMNRYDVQNATSAGILQNAEHTTT